MVLIQFIRDLANLVDPLPIPPINGRLSVEHLDSLVPMLGFRTRENLLTWLAEQYWELGLNPENGRRHYQLPPWYYRFFIDSRPEIDRITNHLYSERIEALNAQATIRNAELARRQQAEQEAQIAAEEQRLAAEHYNERLQERLRELEARKSELERRIEAEAVCIQQRDELERRKMEAHIAANERRLAAEYYQERLNERLRGLETRKAELERQIEADSTYIQKREEVERCELEALRLVEKRFEIQATMRFIYAVVTDNVDYIRKFLRRRSFRNVIYRSYQGSPVYEYAMTHGTDEIRQMLKEARDNAERS